MRLVQFPELGIFVTVLERSNTLKGDVMSVGVLCFHGCAVNAPVSANDKALTFIDYGNGGSWDGVERKL